MLRQRRNALLQQANVALLLGGRGGAAGSRSRSRGGRVEHPFSSAACFCSSPYANSAEELQAAREAYLREHQRSLAEPESFWAEQAEQVRWFKRWDRVLGSCSPSPRYDYPQWFQGALTNTCYNALDAHVVGEGGSSRASQVALLHDSPVTRSQRRLTYQELLGEVQVMAALLSSKGVQKGDVVLIYMPMIPEAVIAMLACARLGAVHNVV
ncbi:Acyl-CoA synthetase short-chain member 3, mitochondrial, partial [Balamuthia mandrillaris]